MMSSFSAISFVQSWAWYGLAAIIIPIIIHLLSKSRGRLVKWGTTRFLPQAKPIKMTQLKLTQRLLLLLRCLIILFSLAILAKLYITDDRGTDETVVFVNKVWFSHADEQARMQLERYIGLTDHHVVWLDSFQSITKEDLIAFKREINETSFNPLPLNNWYQLSLADTHFRHAKQFIVFSSASSSQFLGEKPLISRPIQWHISTGKFDENINDVVQVPFNIVLFADDGHQTALDYLIPALNAIKQFNVKQLTFQVVTQEKDLNLINRPDWLFYLTNKTMTEPLNEWLSQGTHIFIDGKNNSSIIKQKNFITNGYGLIKPVTIYQYNELFTGATTTTGQQILWSVNKNQANNKLTISSKTNDIIPMLTVSKNSTSPSKVDKKPSGYLYQYNSLFTPQWSELVIQPQFPLVLQSLLFGELLSSQQQASNQISADNLDQLTTIIYEQALTVLHEKEINDSSEHMALTNYVDVYERYHQQILVWLGLILIILFILERLLSEYSIRLPIVVNKDD